MIVYSVSCTMQQDIADEWQQFFVEKHLKDVVNTGCFTSYSFRRLLDGIGEEVTFVSEYYAHDMAAFERYNAEFGTILKKDVQDLFSGKYKCTRAIYEKIV